MYIKPTIFNSNKIIAAQSTRKGGVSKAPFASLNLGYNTNDNRSNIIENRKLFFNAIGANYNNVALSNQTHSTNILIAKTAVLENGYDAIITTTPNLFIAVTIADCVPILIHDTKNNIIAAVHAGWKGTKDFIVLKTINKMQQQFNTKSNNCLAYIGTCISKNQFEVNNDVAVFFNNNVKSFNEKTNKYHIDLKAENTNQLIECGLNKQNIEISDYCTALNNDLFFSHRKENGFTGRMLATIGII